MRAMLANGGLSPQPSRCFKFLSRAKLASQRVNLFESHLASIVFATQPPPAFYVFESLKLASKRMNPFENYHKRLGSQRFV